jgi:hypothetical protein
MESTSPLSHIATPASIPHISIDSLKTNSFLSQDSNGFMVSISVLGDYKYSY